MLTIDQLYEAYMDEDTPFAEDVYQFFGGADTGFTAQEWAADYGMYLPTYDPTQVELAARERDLDYQRAADILDISNRVAGRVYATETDILGTKLGTELEKSRQVSGQLGLRSGTLEGAVEDTIAATSNKVEDLGDRFLITKEKDDNTYNTTMVDAALDFDKSEHQSKKELYQRTLAQISKLTELGAFEEQEEDSTDGTGFGYYDENGQICTCSTTQGGQNICYNESGNDCDPVWASADPDWCAPNAPCDNPISCCYDTDPMMQFCLENPEALECQEGPGMECCLFTSDPNACNANPEAYGCGGSNACTSEADCSCPDPCENPACVNGVCSCVTNPLC